MCGEDDIAFFFFCDVEAIDKMIYLGVRHKTLSPRIIDDQFFIIDIFYRAKEYKPESSFINGGNVAG
jgi:hypothetical protein